MGLKTPQSAILSAVIFNALIIVCLIPLALKGVRYRAVGAARALRDNLLIYGLGGLITPFVGIKAIDMPVKWSPRPSSCGKSGAGRPRSKGITCVSTSTSCATRSSANRPGRSILRPKRAWVTGWNEPSGYCSGTSLPKPRCPPWPAPPSRESSWKIPALVPVSVRRGRGPFLLSPAIRQLTACLSVPLAASPCWRRCACWPSPLSRPRPRLPTPRGRRSSRRRPSCPGPSCPAPAIPWTRWSATTAT